MKKIIYAISTLMLVALLFNGAYAQTTGKIAGKVIDAKTSETLIGATVNIEGTTTGAATDVDGKYTLSGLKPGKYTVLVRYIGYQTKSVSDVEVKAGEVTALNITASASESTALKEVVVRATYRQASVASLYAVQKNSVSISDGISSEVIKRSPDRNTADVLKRVSGATVQDNKFVVIRGLSDRYNTALLDGGPLPSTENNRKAFSFDIVPSNLVENLTITKTATPDNPGDFAGGLIHIQTKDLPDQNFISFGIAGGYNTASTGKDFISGPRNTSDYFGFDNGKRQLPNGFATTDQVTTNALTQQQSNANLRAMPNDWNRYVNTALPTQNYQFSIGRVHDAKESGNRFGAIFALTYRNQQNIYSDIQRDFYQYKYNDDAYKFSTNVGALLNLGYTFGKNKITFKNVYNRIYDDQYLGREGHNNSDLDVKYYAFDLQQKALLKSTLEGNHPIGEKGAKLNWELSYGNVLNDQPGQRKALYTRQTNSGEPFRAQLTSLTKENSTLFGKLNEDSYSGGVNYSMPVKLFTQSTFKAGVSSLYRTRRYDVRFVGPLFADAFANDPNNFDELNQIMQRPLNTLFAPDLINRGVYKLAEVALTPSDSYTANSTTNAGYLMLDNKLTEKLRFVWGARVEQFTTNVTPISYQNPGDNVHQQYTDILPSANLTYALTEKINLRASYSRTLARPEFRELATSQYYDYELLAFQQGNPNLKRTNIDNFDVRFELFPSAGQIFSVSGFYKKFKNAIEAFNSDGTSTRIIQYFNSARANVYGVELEARKSLDFIKPTDFLKNTTVYANVSVAKSVADNPVNAGINLQYKDRPLLGQAPYVINAGVQHSFLNNKLIFNALYNRVGPRLSLAAGALYKNVFDVPRDVIDAQLGLKVLKGKGEIKINAGDILNQRFTFFFDDNNNKRFDKGDYTQSSYRVGSTYTASFTYTL
ncbi:TonB-dependent receptor [Mucilaginibacter conchicola]|uniref:TonB-dependent receptor n=1 Tax=Mucilaginibacter conchicola TaxID=2303333 RepID=UPI001F467A6D|nr:TonB-dependent receptor [Mucilaginibacter conchicola]